MFNQVESVYKQATINENRYFCWVNISKNIFLFPISLIGEMVFSIIISNFLLKALSNLLFKALLRIIQDPTQLSYP